MSVLKTISSYTVKTYRTAWKRSKAGFVLMVALDGVKIYIWYRVIRWLLKKI